MPKRNFFGSADSNSAAEDAALAAAVESVAVGSRRRTVTQDVAPTMVDPNPYQARVEFPGIAALAAEIQAQGFTSRLWARPHPAQPGRYQIVYGERRLRAALQADLATIPLEIGEFTDTQMYEIGLAENDQRVDLTPLEQARAYQQGIDHFGLTVPQLAERIGRDRSYINDRLAALRAPADVQHMIEERSDSLRAAREISKLEDPAQRAPLIAGVLGGTLNTTDVRALAQAVRENPATVLPGARHPTVRGNSPDPHADMEEPYDDPAARPKLIADTFGELRLSYPTEELLREALAEMQHFYGDRVQLRAMRQPGRKGDWLAYGTLRARQAE